MCGAGWASRVCCLQGSPVPGVLSSICQESLGWGGGWGKGCIPFHEDCCFLPRSRGKSQVALKIIRNVGKYREAARLEINVLKKIKEKDKENKL